MSKGQDNDDPWATFFEDLETEVEEESVSPPPQASVNQRNEGSLKNPLDNTKTHQDDPSDTARAASPVTTTTPASSSAVQDTPSPRARDSDDNDQNERSLPSDRKKNSNKLPDTTSSDTSFNSPKAKNDLKGVRYILPDRDDLVSVHPDIVLKHLKRWATDSEVDSIEIEIIRQKGPPTWLLHANSEQHEEMSDIVHRMHDLVHCTLRQIQTLILKTKDSVRLFAKTVTSCARLRTQAGKIFVRHLKTFLVEKETELNAQMETDMTDKCRSLVVKGTIQDEVTYGGELEYYTQVLLQWRSIERHFEDSKRTAFHAFINDSKETWKLEKYDAETEHVLGKFSFDTKNVESDKPHKKGFRTAKSLLVRFIDLQSFSL